MATRYRILVVDDDADSLRYVTELLKAQGDMVHVATDGALALRIAREVPLDLILLDIQMPGGLDGVETCRRLKADEATRAIPVLFLTGRDDQEVMVRAFDAGGADYLLKPFDDRVLQLRIRTQVELATATRGLESALDERTRELGLANQRLRQLAAELALVEETERRRLATNLHDSPMQKLALAQMHLATGMRAPQAAGVGGFDKARELLRETATELRSLQTELSPPLLHQEGLAPALDWLASDASERFGVAVVFDGDGAMPAIVGDPAVLLYQCARELIHNMAKHARASQGRITLAVDSGDLLLTVADNGVGIQQGGPRPTNSKSGFGLFSIRERLALLDGRLELESDAAGTRARVTLPLASTGNG